MQVTLPPVVLCTSISSHVETHKLNAQRKAHINNTHIRSSLHVKPLVDCTSVPDLPSKAGNCMLTLRTSASTSDGCLKINNPETPGSM
jgi:hypothetical protein